MLIFDMTGPGSCFAQHSGSFDLLHTFQVARTARNHALFASTHNSACWRRPPLLTYWQSCGQARRSICLQSVVNHRRLYHTTPYRTGDERGQVASRPQASPTEKKQCCGGTQPYSSVCRGVVSRRPMATLPLRCTITRCRPDSASF